MQNQKKKIINTILTIPGIMKNKSIENTLTSNMVQTIGPSIKSTKENPNVLSKIPRSFENLLVSCPVGVISKKNEGLLTSP